MKGVISAWVKGVSCAGGGCPGVANQILDLCGLPGGQEVSLETAHDDKDMSEVTMQGWTG